MGSSGTNSFSDYPGSSGGKPGGKSGGGGGGGGSGGGGGKSDKCETSIDGLPLEEVALAEYFTKNGKPPTERTKIRVRAKLVNGRVAVETESGNEVIGYVPTAYNYLLQCMTKGWRYRGSVSSSSAGKIPKVKVDISAAKK